MSNKTTTYKTKQSMLVFDCFEKNKDKHLNVDDIYSFLKENSTPVGKTTIYRQVQKLLDEGVITKYSVDNETGACFQYSNSNCKMHFHLKCNKCTRLFHASCEFIESVQQHVFSHHGFMVDNSKTVFYGVCSECMRREKRISRNEKEK